MDPFGLTEEQRSLIRAQKRAVWAQQGAGRHYHHLAHQRDPIIRLKNLTELSFVRRHALGPRILDAGAGTGRFTFSLRDAGHTVLALDISRDMLLEGRAHGAALQQAYPCAQGEIERLPFADGTFDSVVSMTVLRHFPNWEPLLDEYVRVVREGGRVIVDMASGEQQQFGDAIGIARPHLREGFQALEFDAGVTFQQIRSRARQRGLCIEAYQAHDFFNGNLLLKHAMAGDYDDFMSLLRQHLDHACVLQFCELVHRRFLPALGPATCGSVLLVLGKHDGPDWVPPEMPESFPQTRETPEKALEAALRRALGRRYASFVRETSPHLKAPEVARFVAFCRDSILPRWPGKTWNWDSGGHGRVAGAREDRVDETQ